MRRSKIGRRTALGFCILTSATLALSPVSEAKEKKAKARATTGSATHVLGSSALLTGVVFPNGPETSYFFQYGPTIAYGSQTPSVSLGAGTGNVKVKVGQAISGLQSGVTYHYRIFATGGSPVAQVLGRDRVFTAKGTGLRFEVTKAQQGVVGSPVLVTGRLFGLESGNHKIALQSSPFPYLEPFSSIGSPYVTNAAGAFSFRVTGLTTSTQFRLVTLDARPIYSPIITDHLAVRVTFSVRSTARKGFVRIFGTVTPTEVGAKVLLQVQKAVRPGGKSETTEKAVTQFSTVVKKGSRTVSRYSAVVSLRRSGRYRVFVRVRSGGPLVSGFSRSIVLRAGSSPVGKKGKH